MRYETRCVKVKLRPGSLERVREWAMLLNETGREEALLTLREEAVILEAYFLDRTSEGDFLIAFMKAESFDKAQRVFETSTHNIDQYHLKFKMDTWESSKQLELLIDLDRITVSDGPE